MRRLILALAVIIFVPDSAYAAKARVVDVPGGFENDYIVLLSEDTPTPSVRGLAESLARTYGLELVDVWPEVVKGFRCLGPRDLVKELANDPRVLVIEQNSQEAAGGMSSSYSTFLNGEYLWHLDRLDEYSYANRQTPGKYDMCHEGHNVYAYVMDLAINTTHPELVGRVANTVDFSGEGYYLCSSSAWHGTAVASLVGGVQVGSARTSIVAMKMAPCGIYFIGKEDMMSALEWIGSTSNPHVDEAGVIVYSGYFSKWTTSASTDATALSEAVVRAVQATGFPFFTSADNYSGDSCKFAPNDKAYTKINTAGHVFSVGGTTLSGATNDYKDYRFQKWTSGGAHVIGKESGSNSGACISTWAPGGEVYAARLRGYDRESGTSFSAPLVAGLAARYIQKYKAQYGQKPHYSNVYQWLISRSTAPAPNNTTTPSYNLCISDTSGQPTSATTGTCPSGTTTFPMPSVGNSTGVGVIYWDEGVCP